MTTRTRLARLAPALVGIAVLLGISGCAGQDASPAAPASPSASSPTTSPDPSAAPVAFRMPDDCAGLLPSSRLDAFAADGLELLGGPGGVYGTDYFPEPTPEEAQGGLTCVWGVDEDVRSVIAVSVAPLSASARADVVGGLVEQGLNERVEGETAVYAQVGDEISSSAQLNVLRGDSWVSVLPAAGGEAVFDAATAIAEEVAAQVYIAG